MAAGERALPALDPGAFCYIFSPLPTEEGSHGAALGAAGIQAGSIQHKPPWLSALGAPAPSSPYPVGSSAPVRLPEGGRFSICHLVDISGIGGGFDVCVALHDRFQLV